MANPFPGEQWKNVKFDFDYSNDFRLEVSNYGRLRTFNKISDGNIIAGSQTGGYPIIRMKFFRERDERMQEKFNYMRAQAQKLERKIRLQQERKEKKAVIRETEALLADFREKMKLKGEADLKERAMYHHALIHRLVATYFLPKPRAAQTIVSHLDHNKLNNRAGNLKWMTPDENYAHQTSSPLVLEEREKRASGKSKTSTKLSTTKVMLMKKLMNQGKTMKQLSKQFKVTETQVLRIKRGENWGTVQAAK